MAAQAQDRGHEAANVIYLDNAASSHPKPDGVYTATLDALRLGANPGRSGHRAAVECARLVSEARAAVAELFGIADPSRVVFTHNGTHALNQALHGSLRPGDHVVTTTVEHNSILRPLNALRESGVSATYVRSDAQGRVSVEALQGGRATQHPPARPDTRLQRLRGVAGCTGSR